MLKYLYIKILELLYIFLGQDYYEKLVLEKINFVYYEINNNELIKKINVIDTLEKNDFIYNNIKQKYNIISVDHDYRQLCIKIYIIGNILRNNQKLILKKDFINALYCIFKYASLNNITFYDSYNNNETIKRKFNSIIFNYNENYDLIYINDFMDNNNLHLKHVPNKDRISYGIKWCNNSKKFIFNYQ
jgi:hypothetical protein